MTGITNILTKLALKAGSNVNMTLSPLCIDGSRCLRWTPHYSFSCQRWKSVLMTEDFLAQFRNSQGGEMGKSCHYEGQWEKYECLCMCICVYVYVCVVYIYLPTSPWKPKSIQDKQNNIFKKRDLFIPSTAHYILYTYTYTYTYCIFCFK